MTSQHGPGSLGTKREGPRPSVTPQRSRAVDSAAFCGRPDVGETSRGWPRSAVTCSAFLAVCRECTEVQRDVRTVTADGVCAVVTLGPPNFRLYFLMQSMSLSLTCAGKSSLGSAVVCEAVGSPETQTSEPPAW